MRDLATEAELDAALAQIGRTTHISSPSVDAELLKLNHRLRSETVRETEEHAAPRQRSSPRQRATRAILVGLAAVTIAAFTFAPAIELWFTPDAPTPSANTAAPVDGPAVHDRIPEWLPLPDGISASAVEAAGTDIIVDFAADPASLSANETTPDPDAIEAAINTNYLRVGLCIWANEWVSAHTATLTERQNNAAAVLQQSQSWPGMAETPYAPISATMADAAVRGDAPAVGDASLPLLCSALNEALDP